MNHGLAGNIEPAPGFLGGEPCLSYLERNLPALVLEKPAGTVGLMLVGAGDPAGARRALEHAAQIDGRSFQAFSGLVALDMMSGNEVEAAFTRYVNARYLRTARVQYESRYLWDNFYHLGGIEREVMRDAWEKKTEQQMFDCVSWLYDGFKLPQKREAA